MVKLKNKFDIKKTGLKILILVSFLMILFLIGYSKYYNSRQDDIVLKTQYTFTTRIDDSGNVYTENQTFDGSFKTSESANVMNLGIDKIAEIWLSEFTGQFEQRYIARSKAIKNVVISKPEVINLKDNIILLEFSCEPLSDLTEYFSSWGGYMAEGKIVCEWVVTFEIEDLYDGTAKIYAKSIQMPEDYGIAAKTEMKNETETVTTDKEAASKAIYNYQIKEDKLLVTYDGGEKWILVPVDIDYLLSGKTLKTSLLKNSYYIGRDKTAFLYGGSVSGGQKVPLTVIFSSDKGSNWTSTLVSDISNVNYWYVNFIDENEGFIVVGFERAGKTEKNMVFRTGDGGESWFSTGIGSEDGIIRDAVFLDYNKSYIVYEYSEGMETNLYKSTDGGVTYEPVILGPQQFEDSNTKLDWNQVYKDYQIPYFDSNGILNLIIKQGSNGDYNGGDTVAKYQSSDNGSTWKYIGEE